jgi:Tn3 transposase DDE domain
VEVGEDPVGCAKSDVASELPIRSPSHGRVTAPLTRPGGYLRAVEARLPDALPLHPAARPAGPRQHRQGPGGPGAAPPPGGRPTTLGRALAEYGRVAKTLHLLAFVDADESYRRQIGAQLNLQESRHRLARKVFHGQRGELRQRYREGQEDQLGVLGLVVNAIVLWNTGDLDAAVARLRAAGEPIADADLARLSPLGDIHINLLGRYYFPTTPVAGGLRPLRDPDQPDDHQEPATSVAMPEGP